MSCVNWLQRIGGSAWFKFPVFIYIFNIHDLNVIWIQDNPYL